MPSLIAFLYVGSVVCQLVAVVFALRMARHAKYRAPWLAMSVALVVQTVHRIIGFLSAGPSPVLPISTKGFAAMTAIFAFGVSLLLFVALFAIRRLAARHETADAAREQQAAELRESQQRLAAALAASQTGTFRWDIRTNALDWDHNLDHLFGLPAGQTARSLDQFLALVHPDDRAGIVARCERCAAEGTDFDMEFRVIWPDGSIHWLDDKGKTVKDENGRPLYMTGACVDVTRWKQTEEALHGAREESERANRTKDDFLAALSHELRTPLAPVLLSTQLLEHDASLPPKVREDLRNIRRGVEIETRLIDDLLDLTRVARGKVLLLIAPTDVHEVLRHSIDTCRDDLFTQKKLQLNVDLAASSHWATADAARLGQVFWNLIKNATKFTPDCGTIEVRTFNRDDGRSLLIEVTDTGVGIEPSVLPHIFNAFEQGGSHVTRQFGGLGLGLSISKALAELHGGKISARSEGAGRGTTFTFELPTTVPSAAEIAVKPERPVHASEASLPDQCRSILLVEDHEPTGRVMKRLLSGFGYDVEWADSVGSALRAASARKFDLVVSDLGLPDGTGHELMMELKARYNLRGVALSGYGMEHDVDRSAESGFVRHLTKPVTIEKLDAVIRDVCA